MRRNKKSMALYEVPHCQQQDNWDCGLACLVMALHPLELSIRDLEAACAEQGVERSIWTIDLCYLLHRYGTRLTFTTVTLGVDPSYGQEGTEGNF